MIKNHQVLLPYLITAGLVLATVYSVEPPYQEPAAAVAEVKRMKMAVELQQDALVIKPAHLVKEKKKYTAKDRLSPQQLKSVLYEAGFRGENLREAWGTAMKESTGRPMAHNKNSDTGDNSYGLFQINMIGDLGPARLEKYNLDSNEDLFDPLTNAKIAYQMSNGGKNWSAWHGLTERTLEWMQKFPD